MELEPDSISELMHLYRMIKVQRDTLDADLEALKAKLAPLVQACGGKWQDETGYARIVLRQPTVSYKADALDALCASWPELRAQLWPHRREIAYSPYLQVK